MLTRLKLHHESLLPFQFAASQLLILLSDSVLHCRVCCDELCVRTVQLRGTTVEPKQKKNYVLTLVFEMLDLSFQSTRILFCQRLFSCTSAFFLVLWLTMSTIAQSF